VQYKSTLPLTNPKAVVNQKYKADAQSTGFLPIFSDDFITKPVLGPELVTRVLSRIKRTRPLLNPGNT
jgi:DNA-binding response OmpR family regulator